MASFFAGAATASFIGFYVLYKDYKVAHQSISQQMVSVHYAEPMTCDTAVTMSFQVELDILSRKQE